MHNGIKKDGWYSSCIELTCVIYMYIKAMLICKRSVHLPGSWDKKVTDSIHILTRYFKKS